MKFLECSFVFQGITVTWQRYTGEEHGEYRSKPYSWQVQAGDWKILTYQSPSMTTAKRFAKTYKDKVE